MAGLTTAWELSSGDWRQRFDSITIVQRGWRLGGKGASSRGHHGRIEEHGLHVLLGYYDATFRVLREVYEELDRGITDPACPIRTWRDAFVPSGDVGLADRQGETWSSFVTRFSGNDEVPGEPGAEDRPITPMDAAVRAVRLLADFHRVLTPPLPAQVYLSASPVPRPSAVDVSTVVRAGGLTALAAMAEVIERTARLVGEWGLEGPVARTMARVLEAWRADIRLTVLADPDARRTWQLVDLVVSNLLGMLRHGLLSGNGYDRIDHLDYREWLALQGADPATLDSPIVRGMYDLAFAYVDGDRARPRFAAGLGLQLAMRMLFDFKGAIFWRMQAGMGEVVFAPLYQALARRGVEFRFFRRLERLTLWAGRSIGSIELTRQADLAPGRSRYDPLVRHDCLPCWPDRPLTGQLEGDPGPGLESHRNPVVGGCREILRAGRDFDVVVLAVSLGMVPHVASELVTTAPAWRAMVARVATVATHAAQLWLDATESELGWEGPSGVTLTGFGDSFDTWASMPHLLPREGWGSATAPRGLVYFCGAMPDADATAGEERVRERLVRFLNEEVGVLWPRAADSSAFRWDVLWDDQDRQGPDRLGAQFVSANTDPSDRYVQSLPGSGRHRIAPGQTGFENLAVAGDWTACGLDAGCVEAATRSGVLAARAILSGSVAATPRQDGIA